MKRALLTLSAMLLGCSILATGARAQAQAQAPCCSITAVNATTGVVTAKVNADGQTFTFTVSNAAVLKGLKVGQGVYANLTAKQVSLDGKSVAGSIVSITAALQSGIKSTPSGGSSNSQGSSSSGTASAGSGTTGDVISSFTVESTAFFVAQVGYTIGGSGLGNPGDSALPPTISIDLTKGTIVGGVAIGIYTMEKPAGPGWTGRLFPGVPGISSPSPAGTIALGSWPLVGASSSAGFELWLYPPGSQPSPSLWTKVNPSSHTLPTVGQASWVGFTGGIVDAVVYMSCTTATNCDPNSQANIAVLLHQ